MEDPKIIAERILANVEKVIIGKSSEVRLAVICLLCQGHLLIEDVPGVGKTTLARSLAKSAGCSFKRIQFTPDILPSDVTGVSVYNQRSGDFEFRTGPITAQIVLADEINRATPKTQSALLEAMEEAQVTVDGTTYDVPQPFTVVATQNSVEPSRTYDLPMAELDRFMKRLELGYPAHDAETELLDRAVGEHPIRTLDPVATVETIRRARTAVANVTVSRPIREYATDLAAYTREHATLGVSPRGTIALLRAAQARAILDERDYVVPDDVQAEAHAVLSHRIKREGNPDDSLVERALEHVAVP